MFLKTQDKYSLTLKTQEKRFDSLTRLPGNTIEFSSNTFSKLCSHFAVGLPAL